MRRAFMSPKRDEEEKLFLITMKRRNCPHMAQTQCWWAPR